MILLQPWKKKRMKKYNVVVQLLAQNDVREARQWYNLQQPGLGKRFTTDMGATLAA